LLHGSLAFTGRGPGNDRTVALELLGYVPDRIDISCIERNAFGTVKAVNAAMPAPRGDGSHVVSLDNCIGTMRDTGRDMNSKHKKRRSPALPSTSSPAEPLSAPRPGPFFALL
jgi:hypothetical protein